MDNCVYLNQQAIINNNSDYQMQYKKIDNYKVSSEVLGSGAFSTVYSAVSSKNKRLAAKVIPTHNIKDKQMKYFEREINLLRKCKSQYIVDFVDLKKTDSNFYIFLEHCDGGSLADYIARDKRLPEMEAVRIFSQIIRGMSCMKAMNIIHRDLKPANIMLKNGNVKIVDFGLARKFYHGQLLKTIVGSPLNMAPEVLKGQNYSEKVDIYSVGTILYQMLYGICPFEARNRELLIKEIDRRKFNKVKDNVEVSENVLNILKEMLEPEPSKRIELVDLLDFVHTYEKDQNDKKLRRFQKMSRKYKNHYGMFGSIAGGFMNYCKVAEKGPLNLDFKMCSRLINEIHS